MSNQSHFNGFMKRAQQYGFSETQAREIYKQAIPHDENDARFSHRHKIDDSSWPGRYFDMKALRGQTMLEHPFKATGGGLVGQAASTGLGGLLGAGLGAGGAAWAGGDHNAMLAGGAGGGALGGILGSYAGSLFGAPAGQALASQGLNEDDRREELDKTDEKLSRRSTIGNAAISGAKMVPLTALLGALGGGAFSGVGAMHNGWQPEDLKSILSGAGTGAVTGGLAGLLGGGVTGGVNSLIHKHTSPETHARSKQMLRRHPVATQLPFGDVVGAHDA